jgi:23S rRNA (adenine2503-C2)-methyltransferase
MLQQVGGQPLVGMDLKDLEKLLGPDEPAYRARQIYDAVYRKQVANLSGISNLPKTLRTRLFTGQSLGLPAAEHRYDSSDGTLRYLLRLQDNRTIEAVLMPEQGRDTICISSQVGCPVDCKFCLTALMGLERNLTAGEIVGQVLYIARENRLNPDARLNVVMMGMGEPLLNLDNVLKATRLMTDPDGVAMSPKRITVSTSGIVPKIVEMGQAEIRPKLAISLNASTGEQRQRLMPITRKYPLSELMQTCREYPLRSWEKLTFEYVLLRGVNDSDADARRVVRLLGRINCKVNLIAFNPGPGIRFETPEPERIASFQAILKRSVPCFIRKPRGRDIYAACGQLKRVASDLVGIRAEPE